MLGRRLFAVGMLAAAVAAAAPALAAQPVPVRVRVIKGSRQGAGMDPQLADLAGQLGKIAYTRWDQVGEHPFQMELGKAVSVGLPDGARLELTIVDSRKDTVTFQVSVPARKTQAKLTISKDQRIVHQVTDEKGGEAFFVTIRPWP